MGRPFDHRSPKIWTEQKIKNERDDNSQFEKTDRLIADLLSGARIPGTTRRYNMEGEFTDPGPNRYTVDISQRQLLSLSFARLCCRGNDDLQSG
jgi:hypothetical protein